MTRASSLSPPLRGYSDFPKPAGISDEVTGFRVFGQHTLKLGVGVVVQKLGNLFREKRRFDEKHAQNYAIDACASMA